MRSFVSTSSAVLALSLAPVVLGQLKIDVSKPDTLRAAAKVVMQNLVNDYTSQKPFVAGLLPSEYSFFESGVFFNTVLNYAAFTGDKTYNSLFEKDFFNQIGENANFIPRNSSARIVNDDVGYWALAAMSAAEFGASPADTSMPSYLTLADNVFNDFVRRWDDKACGGGLRWAIQASDDRYDFKDTNSNGVFFELAARLGFKTGNTTYFDWANKVYDWTAKTKLIGTLDTNNLGQVLAGASVKDKCQQVDQSYYSAQQANYVYGAAIMYAKATTSTWLDRLGALVHYTSSAYFGPQQYVDDGRSQVVNEAGCEYDNKCTLDQKAGKAILFRSLAVALRYNDLDVVMKVQISNSARAAAKSCNGDGDCGFKWDQLEYDATKGSGYGEKMAAVESFLALVRETESKPMKGAFEPQAQTESPSTTDTSAPASETSAAPEASRKPNSGSRLAVSGALGGAVLASLLHMLL
ncbi:hydrolase 76 protein [Orbilia oligospora]|uniref:Mannan endo-1,6-alpha-mannosidase n=1 Tax=Orbilia oligospora TaxID=2813651 RepID=A0A6G1MLR1_ORBOL|nr:hydrolase 76 protein [Orbilia oligospora]KAF3193873.1 hydrolase 76 protein [Orbilia oligospora]KAF3217214.1 hydrolase 76 protein [Orbilia oligospora]KAF3232009.1 hydrolase 76 protein [Orbilia oligospora]KAF3263371.1 hydrolase 76 protein [Orbilia oligospora]